jgi:limonene-1,2-epoxide hydrolase
MDDRERQLRALYAAFNDRDLERALGGMTDDVDWPNGWEGGRVLGRDAVAAYWRRQWAAIDPHVEPLSITDDGATVSVEVQQTVRDLNGNQLADDVVVHRYVLRDGLIARMDIEEPG